MKKEDFTHIPMEDLMARMENGVFRHIVNNYWLLDEDGCALVYRGFSYQCNADERIIKGMLDNDDHPAVTYKLIPSAWVPYDTSEYT